MTTCAFTGHRPWHLGITSEDYPLLKRLLYQAVERAYSLGAREFISGMALGTDQWAAAEVIRFRKAHGDVILHCALPCSDQSLRWNERDKQEYEALLRLADRITTLSDKYESGCMQARDKWMIDRSDRLIAVYTGQKGGTSITVRLAQKKGIPIDFVMFQNELTRPSEEMLGRGMKLV